MKGLIILEELAMFGLAIVGFTLLDYSWWVFPALLLVPDLSMFGYLVNPRLGALLYNLVHHKLTGIAIFCMGLWGSSSELQLSGLILFGHSSMDRMFGYGLKYNDAFTHTHLGIIGKK